MTEGGAAALPMPVRLPVRSRSLRRRILTVLVLVAALFAGAVVVLWFVTPSGADVQTRVRAEAATRGVGVLPESSIPLLLSRGIVATEDERFYQHHGIDYIGVVRSMLYDVQNGCFCQGASTITEQLVKQVYLGGSDQGWNKVVDVIVAYKVENVIGKGQIMADYVSIAPTGPSLYGMPAASCAYFGRPIEDLDLAQLATLAGLPQAPTTYDPLTNPNAARQRRLEVLGLMVSEHYITQSQADAAAAEPLLPWTPLPAQGC